MGNYAIPVTINFRGLTVEGTVHEDTGEATIGDVYYDGKADEMEEHAEDLCLAGDLADDFVAAQAGTLWKAEIERDLREAYDDDPADWQRRAAE